MKKALCLLLASVLALSLAACSESSAQDSQAGGEKTGSSAAAEPTEKPAEKSDPAEQEAAIEVTAKELLKEYDDNEVKADETYRDKLVTVTGIINDIGKDVLDDTYVAVGTGDDYEFTTVQCYFSDEGELAKVGDLEKGAEITVTGTCDGLSINVLLKDCVLK